jgi:hypothetical protein
MTDPANRSERMTYPPGTSPAWWSISSDALMELLYAVKNGRSPESVYVEAYNNSIREKFPEIEN